MPFVLSLLAGGLCALGYLIWRGVRAYVGAVVQEGIAAGTISALLPHGSHGVIGCRSHYQSPSGA